MSVISALSSPTRALRRSALIGLIIAMAIATVGTAPAVAAKPPPALATPTSIVVSDVGQRSIDLKIGGAVTQKYDVYVNGTARLVNAPSSATLAVRILYLQPGTNYSIQVRLRRDLQVSAFSSRITVRTLPGATVAPVSNLRVVSTSTAGGVNTITIAWDASPTPGVSYNILLNGQGNQSTSLTTAVVGESLNCYPGPCVGTGPKSGTNTITVEAGAFIDGFFVQSTPVSITANP